jgi:DNA-binding NarL/FixJ family response regulator
MVEELQPHVVLTGIELRDRSGIDLAAELSTRKSPTRVLILTGYAAHEYLIAALTAGALGYVLKSVGYDELIKGIHAVSAGQVFVSVREASPPAPLPPKAAEERHLHISPREREVLAFVAQGHTNKHTARVLKISIKTVEKHRGNLMRKLDLHGAAALTWYAMDHGLVVIPENFRRAVAN